jgi:hypothetical protein
MHASPSDFAAVDTISLRLHEQAACMPRGMLWLAIDGAGLDGPPALQALLEARKSSIVRVRLPHRDLDTRWFPQWIPLDPSCAEDSGILRESVVWALDELAPSELRRGRGRRIAGWIHLGADPACAADRLGAAMVATKPSGKQCLLRLHDPAVLWTLWRLLRPSQHADLLCGIQTWWLLSPVAELEALARPQCEAAKAAQSNSFTTAQWLEVDHIAAFHHALRMRLAKKPALDLPGLELACQMCMDALRRARSLGFSDDKDLACFAEHALCTHPMFDQLPAVRERMAARKPGQTVGAVLATLSEEDWQVARVAAPAA